MSPGLSPPPATARPDFPRFHAVSLGLILSGTDRRFQDPIKFLFVCVALSTLAMNLNLGQHQSRVPKLASAGPAADPGLMPINW